MDKNLLLKIYRESPCIKLLKSRNAEFILSFLTDVFSEQTTIESERLHRLLENRLDAEIDFIYKEEDNESNDFTPKFETNEDKAKRWIQDWANRGFLTNYQDESGEIMYEISSYTSKLTDWLESLKKEDYIGTESKFKSIFYQLQELVEFTNEDREKRLEMLRQKKMEIEHQIQRLEIGEDIKVFQEYEIEPRFKSLNKLAKELLSDFKEVDNNFKEIIRQIYQRQIDNSQKKEVLSYFFDAYGELKNSSQGKSFYAFWEFLLSKDLQQKWEELNQSLFDTLNERSIETKDNFLRNMHRYLYAAGEKVYKTNDRMSEKLSRIIRQNELTNAEITRRIIDDIKKKLIDTRSSKDRLELGFEVEEININLPIERQLTLDPTPVVQYDEKPVNADLSFEDLSRLEQLFNPYLIDKSVLRHRIDQLLAAKSQTTLQEVIEKNHGINKGLAEVIGYISVLNEYKTVKNKDSLQPVVFNKEEQRVIQIPEILITR